MRRKLRFFNGAMQGRTMLRASFSMGPIGSPMAKWRAAYRLPYVVVNMRIMARIGQRVFDEIDKVPRRCLACTRSARAALAKKMCLALHKEK